MALVVVSLTIGTGLSSAQSIAAPERDVLVRLGSDKGVRPDEIDALVRLADDAGTRGLPAAPLTSKIREGLAKGAAPARIADVVRQMTAHLEAADRLIRDLQPAGTTAEREASVTLLAEALGGRVTAGEVVEIRRQAQATGASSVSAETLAASAKGLSFIKLAGLPATEGTAVMAEALKQGFRAHEMLDLGREIKRRERDYREGRGSLPALRDAIARGDRPDRLFRNDETRPVDRPAATRPEPVTRPEPRPERPQPPERPVRPESAGGARTR